jgi:predicted dehydrogenase
VKRLGLMGCGAIALGRHVPAILETAGLELHAVYEPDSGRRALAREDLGIARAFAEVEPFFASELDVVSVASPAPCHRENVLQAASRRLPVLCEKPLSADRAGTLAMIDAMERAGVPLFTAFCYRFSPAALAIRDLVRAGAVGSVRALRLVYLWGAHGKRAPGRDGRQTLCAVRHGRMLEGGPLVDCGTHQIDLARFWLGSEVVRVAGFGAFFEAEYEAPGHVWAHLDHASGAHTTVEVSYAYGHTAAAPRSEFLYELIGTEGVIRYDRGRRSLRVESREGSRELPFSGEKSFRGMYAELARFLETGETTLLGTARDGLRATEIALEANRQAIERRRAEVEP